MECKLANAPEPRRHPPAGQRVIALSAAAGIVLPGGDVRVVCSGFPEGRPDPGSAIFLAGRVERVESDRGTLIAAGRDLSGLARGQKVQLAFVTPDGLYLGTAAVADVERTSHPPRAEFSVPELRRVQRRRAERVTVPGARATCWLAERVCDAPVMDLSPDGMGLNIALPAGVEVRLRLFVPGADPCELTGLVVWSDPARNRSGISFAGVDEATRTRITFICLFRRAVFEQRRSKAAGTAVSAEGGEA